jgi:3-hydroxybutyryl-CoA dehydrogenase
MDIKAITVIGAGAVGIEYAVAAALGGFRTILEDVSPTALEQGLARVHKRLDQAVEQGLIDTLARDAAIRNLATAGTVEDAIRDAELIIETLPEEMEMHIELFTILDKFAKPGAIFACGTAVLSISEMAEGTFCAERCIGMRLRDGNILELVKGMQTSDETIEICSDFGRRMGKRVTVVHEPESSTLASAGR